MPPERAQWRSIVLRPGIVSLLLAAEVGLIGTIIALWVLSDKRTGFVNVGFHGSGSAIFSVQGALDRGQPLLWTSLPVIVLTLYRLFREAVVGALVVETPFIELLKSSSVLRTKIRKSIYLDYRTSLGIIAWYKALKNGHTFLGLCMLFSFVVSLALVPLAGGLFAEREELSATDATFSLLSTLDRTTDTTLVDYGRFFDIVSASWVFNASYPSGTEGHFPLPRIASVQGRKNYTISLPVTTSQLSLDCQVISDANTTTKKKTENLKDQAFSAIDRDCLISGDIGMASNEEVYHLNALSQQDCPEVAGRTRMVLFGVPVDSSGEIQDSTLISCIPSYWTVNGTVDVVRTTGFNGRLTETPSFSESSRSIEELPDIKRQQFEEGIARVQSINVGSKVNTPDRLAELVARYIDSHGLEFADDNLIRAASTVYPAVYTMLCLDKFYPLLTQPIQQEGVLHIPENRLRVVEPVATAMLVFLAILIVESIYLIIYLHKHPSILAEEPIGLIGAANLLHDSNISRLVAKFHDEPGFDGRLRRPLKQDNKKRDNKKQDKANKKKEKVNMKRNKADKKEAKTKASNTDDSLLDGECWVEQEPESWRLKILVESRTVDAPFPEHAFSAHQKDSALHAPHATRYDSGQQTHTVASLV
jgi:hypothetical protein